jgi:hypothetical protein
VREKEKGAAMFVFVFSVAKFSRNKLSCPERLRKIYK